MTTLSTLTTTQETAIRDWLAAHPTLAVGVGDEHSACSVAAINLALTGTLTDAVPGCMSKVIGRWIIGVQDAMPGTIRNSDAWRNLLPLAAGTGRDHESERLTVIMDWLWETVLPILQPLAESGGFGTAWRAMCATRTATAAHAAKHAAKDAAKHAAKDAAKDAAIVAAQAGYAVDDGDYVDKAACVGYATKYAAIAAYVGYGYGADAAAWATFDPVGLLRRLVAVTDDRVEVGA